MPIEIRELVIKATIADNGQQGGGTQTQNNAVASNDATVQKIVDQVLTKIRSKNER